MNGSMRPTDECSCWYDKACPYCHEGGREAAARELRALMDERGHAQGTDACSHIGQDTWDEYDARGIYLCRVCELCVRIKLAGYRPDVLSDPQYWHDEPLDEHD